MLSFCVLLNQTKCLSKKYCTACFTRYVYLTRVFCFVKWRYSFPLKFKFWIIDHCTWRGRLRRTFSLIVFDIEDRIYWWTHRHPHFVCSPFPLTTHFGGSALFDLFVLFQEAKNYIDTPALSACVTYWWTFTKSLIKDSNWHVLPIDKYLRSF